MIRTIVRALFILLILSLPLSAQPGKLRFSHLGMQDGFSSNEFVSMTLDAQGFAWFGTASGLNYYDGRHVTIYRFDEKDSSSLPSNDVKHLLKDDDGNIWVATINGLGVLNPDTRKFDNYRFAADPNGDHWVHRIYLSRDKKIWLSAVGEVICFDPKTRKLLKRVTVSDTVNGLVRPARAIGSIVESYDGSMWFGSVNSLWHYFPKTGQIKKIILPPSGLPNTVLTSDNAVMCMFEDDDHSLWIGTWASGLRHYDPATGKAETFLFSDDKKLGYNNIITSITRRKNFDRNWLWFSSIDKGIGIFDVKRKTFRMYPHEDGDPYSIKSNYCNAIVEDEAGILWAMTGAGISKLDPYENLFEWRNVSIPGAGIQPVPAISHVVNDRTDAAEHRLWLGADVNGIILYDYVQQKVLRHYKEFPYPPGDLSNHSLVRCLHQDRKNRIWFGNEFGLFRLDTASGKARWYTIEGDGKKRYPGDFTTSIAEDKNGKLWLGCRGGLFCFDPETEKFEKFTPVVSVPHYNNDDRINQMLIDPKGVIWIYTESRQIGTFDPAMKKFTRYDQYIGARAIYEMNSDASGNILFAEANGLFVFHPSTRKTDVYKTSSGLADDVVFAVTADNSGKIWAGTRNGLSCVDPKTKSILNYRSENGLERNQVDNALKLLSDGTMLIGGTGFVQTFQPSLFRPNPYSRAPVITGFSILEKKQAVDLSRASAEPVSVSYTQNIVTFSFAAPNYSHSFKNQYAYKLEGFDHDWIYAGNNTTATYTNLDGGDYVFMVKSANADGIWSQQTSSFRLYVIPPFWKTTWFRVLMIVLIAAIVLFIYFYNIRRIRKEEERKTAFNRRVADAELKALRAQMNPHFIFNCMNTIDALVMKKDYAEASAFLNKFSKLIRMVLENSLHKLIPVERDIDALKLYAQLEQQRFGQQFDVRFDVDEEISEGNFKIPPLLLQPYVENAILHGLRHKEGKGLLSISLHIRQDKLFVVIEDDGIGRKKSRELKELNKSSHRSVGMQVTGERIEIFNFTHAQQASVLIRDRENEKGEACGTRVEIFLPLLTE